MTSLKSTRTRWTTCSSVSYCELSSILVFYSTHGMIIFIGIATVAPLLVAAIYTWLCVRGAM